MMAFWLRKKVQCDFFSARENNEIAGCIAIKRLSTTAAEIKSMRTVHAYRGKRVASKLLSHLIAFARQKGYTSVSLETGTQAYFLPACKLYKKFGFHCSGQIPKSIEEIWNQENFYKKISDSGLSKPSTLKKQFFARKSYLNS